ncbi:MAG TPA: glutamine synthetase, partial [Firmicutes bacterium]|nr:glutamine synthetase [Bacillota bacterium]
MQKATRKRILDLCKKNDIKFVQLWSTDILGQLKSLTLTSEKLPSALEEGASFDGSSVE